jgi:3-hydroxyisobutyrate dehydrogenase
MNVTVLGTGTMGAAIASNLSRGGFATTVWDRSPQRDTALAAVGATVADRPGDAVADADVVITMLADADAVVSVFDHQGTLEALPPGVAWVQMGTIGTRGTDHLAALTAQRRPDVSFVDAPVSGSKGPAEKGELIVLASGPPGLVAELQPLFDAIGRRTIWLGEAGRGTRLKLVLNTWLAFLMEGLAETLTLADDLGIAHHELLDALETGPLAAPAAIAKLHKIDAGDYEPEFALALALKDVDLALESALDSYPALAAIAEQWHHAVADGYGRFDVSAACLALAERSGRRGTDGSAALTLLSVPALT